MCRRTTNEAHLAVNTDGGRVLNMTSANRETELQEISTLVNVAEHVLETMEALAPALQRQSDAGDDGACWMRNSLDEAAAALRRVIAGYRGMTYSRGERWRWWSWYFSDYQGLPRAEAERRVQAALNGHFNAEPSTKPLSVPSSTATEV
jgi:hypothetical protein